MEFLRSKRGAIEVSVNTIIILIFAIAILGLGLTFVRKSMGSATSQFGQVTDDMRTTMMNDLKQSGQRLAIKYSQLTLSKSDKAQMTAENFYAIRNVYQNDYTFNIESITCVSMTGITPTGMTAETYQTLDVKNGASDVQPIKLKITAATEINSYKCTLIVDDPEMGGTYSSQNFFVDVTD